MSLSAAAISILVVEDEAKYIVDMLQSKTVTTHGQIINARTTSDLPRQYPRTGYVRTTRLGTSTVSV